MNIEKNVVLNKTVLILAGLGFMVLWLGIMELILPHIVYTGFRFYADSPTNLQIFFMACVVAPLWETVVYQAGPIKLIKKLAPEYLTLLVVAASCIFAWQHGYGQWGLFIQGIFGLIISIVYIKNNDCFLSAVILHSLYNIYVIYIN